MPGFISGFCFIQADIRRLCFGLMLVGMAFATHAEDGFFVPKFDPLTIRLIHSDIEAPFYRLSGSFMLVHSADTVPHGSGFSSVSRFSSVGDSKKEAVFSPLMRFELKEDRIKITLRPRLVWIAWRKEFH